MSVFLSILFVVCEVDTIIVKRVHWLRARAQLHRWKEEATLTFWEMTWTTRFFLFKANYWKDCRTKSREANQRGGVAYANRQIAFWNSMARLADVSFAAANSTYNKVA